MKNLLLASLLASCLAGCNSDSNDELECSPYPIAIDINNYVVTPEQNEYKMRTPFTVKHLFPQ